MALGALVVAVYYGEPMLKIARWTALKDFHEACLEDRDKGLMNAACKASISEPTRPPPVLKRAVAETWRQAAALNAAQIALTVTAAAVTVTFYAIWLRPYLESRPKPTISLVRTDFDADAWYTSGQGRRCSDPQEHITVQWQRRKTGGTEGPEMSRYDDRPDRRIRRRSDGSFVSLGGSSSGNTSHESGTSETPVLSVHQVDDNDDESIHMVVEQWEETPDSINSTGRDDQASSFHSPAGSGEQDQAWQPDFIIGIDFGMTSTGTQAGTLKLSTSADSDSCGLQQRARLVRTQAHSKMARKAWSREPQQSSYDCQLYHPHRSIGRLGIFVKP